MSELLSAHNKCHFIQKKETKEATKYKCIVDLLWFSLLIWLKVYNLIHIRCNIHLHTIKGKQEYNKYKLFYRYTFSSTIRTKKNTAGDSLEEIAAMPHNPLCQQDLQFSGLGYDQWNLVSPTSPHLALNEESICCSIWYPYAQHIIPTPCGGREESLIAW